MHYSNNESDSENGKNTSNELTFIAEGVAAFPVILENAQVPLIKRMKNETIGVFAKKYETAFGWPLDAKGLLKKNQQYEYKVEEENGLEKNWEKGDQIVGLGEKFTKGYGRR